MIRIRVTAVPILGVAGAFMWFVGPGGPARRRALAVGVIVLLGWLSGLGEHRDAVASPTTTSPARPGEGKADRAGPRSAQDHARRPDRGEPRSTQERSPQAGPAGSPATSVPARPPSVAACRPVSCLALARTWGNGAAPGGGCAGNACGVSGGSPVAGCGTRACAPPRSGQGAAPPPAPAVNCRVVKCVALTFDDGPGPYTARLLDMLAARHARATFFLIGGNIRGREAVVRRELADGHAIGDHTWSHPDLTRLPTGVVRSQLRRTRDAIQRVTGQPTHLMRPPYGATDRHVRKVAGGLGLAQIIWSVDTDDWRDRNSSIVTGRAVRRARRGDIILMHDIHPTTVAAVPRILRGLAERGFTFVTVPELLAAHPLKPGKPYFDAG